MRVLLFVAALASSVAACAPRGRPETAPALRRAGALAELEAQGGVAVVQTVKLVKSPHAPGADVVRFEYQGRPLRIRLLGAVESDATSGSHVTLEVNGVTARFDREAVYELGFGGLLLCAVDMEQDARRGEEADLLVLRRSR